MNVTNHVPSGDLASMLLALMIENRGAQSDASRAEVEHQSQRLEEMRGQIREAMQRAEGAEDSAGFWGELGSVLGGDVAALAGLVAAAALIVATGGAGAPAIVALTAAGLSAGATAGKELGLDPTACMALGAAGGLLGMLGGNVSGATGAWSALATGAKVTQTAAAGASAGASAVAGQYEATALDSQADVAQARARESDAWFRLETALSLLEGASRDLSREREDVAGIQRTVSAANSAVIAQIGAAS